MTPLAKRLSIALALSVAVNLLLGGILVGRALSRPHRGARDVAREAPALRGPEHEERRGALRELYREHGEEFRENRRAIGEARKAARTALEAEPFDRAALENALATLRKETVASQEIMHRSILAEAEKGSAERRKELGHALSRGGPGRHGERGPGRKPKHE
jgi:uncharacterized membrane protein